MFVYYFLSLFLVSRSFDYISHHQHTNSIMLNPNRYKKLKKQHLFNNNNIINDAEQTTTTTGDIGLLRPERLARDGTPHRYADAAGQPSATGAGSAGRSAGTPGTAHDLSAAAPDGPAEHVLGPERIRCRSRR